MSFPICVLLFPFLICSYHLVVAQKGFLGRYCGDTANYTKNQQHLDDALNSLTGTNNGFGYYKSTSAQVNAAALCRGDIDPENCRRCVDDATRELRQVCPNQIEGVGWYDDCFLRYSDQPMSNIIGFYAFNLYNVSDSRYYVWKQNVENLIGTLRIETVDGGQLRKYASKNITIPGFLTIYGMMQCVPDLTLTECDDCLSGASGEIEQYDRRLGVRVCKASCVIRYETYKFFDATWFPGSGNKKINIGVIVGPVVVVLAITLVVLFFLFRRYQKRKRQGLLSPEFPEGFNNTIVGHQEPNQVSNLRPTRDRRNPTHLNDFNDGPNIQARQQPTRHEG